MTRARPCRAIYAAVGALVAMSTGVFTAGGAGAQTGPCPSGGLDMARVSITEPRGGAVTSPVTVRGQAEATLGLTRAELFAGSERVAAQDSAQPRTSFPFDFRWDTGGRVGQVTLRVVVCGPGQVGSSLVWGESSVSADLRPAVSTTAAPTTTRPPVQSQPVAQGTPTTAAPANPATASTVAAPRTGSTKAATTTTAVKPAETEEEAAPLPPSTTVPTRPFVLTEGDDTKKPNRPLWVGVVVGLSGVAGLTFSAVFRWRRTPLPEVVEEHDLVDVR